MSFSTSDAPGRKLRQAQVSHAIEHLKSLRDGEAGLSEVIRLGPEAVPTLRDLLFARERSGLSHARCRAVEALAALKAFDVLAEFLRLERRIPDAVELLGEDAVMSAAAYAIARLQQDWVYRLLIDLAVRRCLGGVLAGLGTFQRKESIPIFVDALVEDDVRLIAETTLRKFGRSTRPDLLAAILDHGRDTGSESESHLRKRRSALALLLDIGINRRHWPFIRPLIDDDDDQIALLACQACIDFGTKSDVTRLSSRLAVLASRVGWLDRERIDRMFGTLRSHSVHEDTK